MLRHYFLTCKQRNNHILIIRRNKVGNHFAQVEICDRNHSLSRRYLGLPEGRHIYAGEHRNKGRCNV